MVLGTLLDVLGVASFFEGLPGHVLLDDLALLASLVSSGGAALPAGGAILLILILAD